MLSPAKSLGHSGFSAEFESSLISWRTRTTRHGETGFSVSTLIRKTSYDGKSFLPMLGLRLVKGLPFSTELGVAFKYLTPSRAFSVGNRR
jgi:hypothetical protein